MLRPEATRATRVESNGSDVLGSLRRHQSRPLLNSTQTRVPPPVGAILSVQDGPNLRRSLAGSAPATTYARPPDGICACHPHQPFALTGAGPTCALTAARASLHAPRGSAVVRYTSVTRGESHEMKQAPDPSCALPSAVHCAGGWKRFARDRMRFHAAWFWDQAKPTTPNTTPSAARPQTSATRLRRGALTGSCCPIRGHSRDYRIDGHCVSSRFALDTKMPN